MNFFRKNIKKNLKKEESDLRDIWRRIKTRDFSGNTGLAIKNSMYQFSTNMVGKIGSFIFVIILARLLMPELFGLYSLALSTILIFSAVSELGINNTLITFVSKEFNKKTKKIKPLFLYLKKIKSALILFSSLILLASARYIANSFYQKPILLALVAGALYIIFIQALGFLQAMLQASNNFRSVFKREVVFQISRIILVPLAVFFALKYSLSDEKVLMLIIFFLAFSLFLASVFLFFDVKKIYLKKLKSEKIFKLPKKQKSTINKFLLATATLALSGVFFGNIDRVMLGHFVEGEFIGYYTAAFSLIGALTPLIGFAAIVLLPIFSRLKGKRLEVGFKKSLKITFLIATGAFLATLFLSYFAILIIFGRDYIPAENVLRIFAVLLFVIPATSIYSSYYLSQGKPNKVAKLLIASTILNIILNYALITSLLPYGQITAVYGAAIATLISKFFYLGGLAWRRR